MNKIWQRQAYPCLEGDPYEIPFLTPIPTIARVQNGASPLTGAVAYDSSRVTRGDVAAEDIVHFFREDHHFESIWNDPLRHVDSLQKAGLVCSPDFSVYSDYPVAVQIWNTYRNRLIGAILQQRGVKTIPTISWADEKSYPYCFAGVFEGSVVAVGTRGSKKDWATRARFEKGFEAMLRAIKPVQVIVIGPPLWFRPVVSTLEFLDEAFKEGRG